MGRPAAALHGTCHCGAVRFELKRRPDRLVSCNCSYCRRSGALWAHEAIENVACSYVEDAVVRYIWGDRMLAFISCAHCGCTTHYETLDPQKHPRMAVNCNMVDPGAIAGIPVRRFDGADSWQYLDD